MNIYKSYSHMWPHLLSLSFAMVSCKYTTGNQLLFPATGNNLAPYECEDKKARSDKNCCLDVADGVDEYMN